MRWPTRTVLQRFTDHVLVDPSTKCWNWAGSTNKGYSRFNNGNKTVDGHRWSYERFRGSIPEGLQVDHLCRNRKCVNPYHMELVTSRENTLRGENQAAKRAAQTHCLRGHEFTPANTSMTKHNQRRCLACHAFRERRRRARQCA